MIQILLPIELFYFKEIQQALNSASDAPLSILIIGMGDFDFTPLQKLCSKRKDGRRDVVQFIHLKSLLNGAEAPWLNKSRIAETALRNVPHHMVQYMHNANIAAKPPIQVLKLKKHNISTPSSRFVDLHYSTVPL